MPNNIKFKFKNPENQLIEEKEIMIYTPDMLDELGDGFLGIDVQNELMNLHNKFIAGYRRSVMDIADTLGLKPIKEGILDFGSQDSTKISMVLATLNEDFETIQREKALSIFRYLEKNILSQVYPDFNFKSTPMISQIKIANGYSDQYNQYLDTFLDLDPIQETQTSLGQVGQKKIVKGKAS